MCIRDSEMTHLPFRSWCRHCIRGRGKEETCRKGKKDDGETPELHIDYMFMGKEHENKTLAILVAKERWRKSMMTTVVPRKGGYEWAARRLVAWTREIGLEFSEITVKGDNEPALVSLTEAWVKLRAAKGAVRTNVENSPVHSSKSNGVIERGVQSIQGMVRTLKSGLEEKWGVELPTCLLYTSPSPRDQRGSRMPSSA